MRISESVTLLSQFFKVPRVGSGLWRQNSEPNFESESSRRAVETASTRRSLRLAIPPRRTPRQAQGSGSFTPCSGSSEGSVSTEVSYFSQASERGVRPRPVPVPIIIT
eukprot:TRINITY_DN55524_c0_g1_i1.p2 TRINITY_DN55524_c0_g1~~TRINITY_DN55524_c0_g1_i1.p2  ORF type:complete len:108 (-),score=9.24 TRINITY_DN55524_c0_g1_i1:251-574(-)